MNNLLVLYKFFEIIFPPICRSCGETESIGLYCSSCWSQCSPPDPVGRCRHCFEEMEEGEICHRCREHPDLFFPRASLFEPFEAPTQLVRKKPDALAGYALYQWIQLEWPMPDFILCLPHCKSQSAIELAQGLQVPILCPLTWWSRTLIEEIIPEDATFLIWDTGTPIEILKRYETEIAQASPKKCFLLSLFPYVARDFDFDFRNGSPLHRDPNCPSRAGLDCREAWKI